MKDSKTKKIAIAGVLIAVAVVGSMFSFPVFGRSCGCFCGKSDQKSPRTRKPAGISRQHVRRFALRSLLL